MKVPSNMTEAETIDQIHLVVNRIAPKYTFHGYTVDDLKQESFIICMDALDRYDSSRPLENFLSVHLSNRLKNFVRDNFHSSEDNKKRIMAPFQLTYEDCVSDHAVNNDDNVIDGRTIQNVIDTFLPPSCRSDYLKIINDVYVTKKRREEIIIILQNIVRDHYAQR